MARLIAITTILLLTQTAIALEKFDFNIVREDALWNAQQQKPFRFYAGVNVASLRPVSLNSFSSGQGMGEINTGIGFGLSGDYVIDGYLLVGATFQYLTGATSGPSGGGTGKTRASAFSIEPTVGLMMQASRVIKIGTKVGMGVAPLYEVRITNTATPDTPQVFSGFPFVFHWSAFLDLEATKLFSVTLEGGYRYMRTAALTNATGGTLAAALDMSNWSIATNTVFRF